MTKIKRYVEDINGELEGAKNYAEMYVDYKARGDNQNAAKLKKMSEDELQHALNLHGIAVDEIEAINKVTNPPQEMMEKWEKAHAEYVEKTAWIRMMLNM